MLGYERHYAHLTKLVYLLKPSLHTSVLSVIYNEVLRSDSHTAVVRDYTVCDNFVDNLVILINLFP